MTRFLLTYLPRQLVAALYTLAALACVALMIALLQVNGAAVLLAFVAGYLFAAVWRIVYAEIMAMLPSRKRKNDDLAEMRETKDTNE